MSINTQVRAIPSELSPAVAPGEPCVLVIFGAAGDLTRRLLLPALYNLACDRLLPERFALVGLSREPLSTDSFRGHLGSSLRKFHTRREFDPGPWDDLAARVHYTQGDFGEPESYRRLADLLARLEAEYQTGGNVLFYLATPPAVFSLIAGHLDQAGLRQRPRGWARLIVEKPFGHDLASARALNRELLAHWSEDQLFRIDHYLGKETVQNLLAFRFANGIFEPLWNKNQVDHVQLTVAETVGVEGRGGYYDKAGVLRDMIQNHMFQMLANVLMEPPASFRADAIRNEKAKLLESVRIPKPEEVLRDMVRGQYGPGRKEDGTAAVGYREEPNVDPQSRTETFAALKLYVDNWRWEGVPIYLRSGKSLWKRGTEIVVQFRQAPAAAFRETPAAGRAEANRLIFHIQPDQGVELRLQAKAPGPALHLQKVNMRFDYQESFEAQRTTGYEVLLYNCMSGDATLFSRTDLVESAWRLAQPILDTWAETAPADLPTYPAGSWGPRAAYDLLARDGRRWVEVVNRGTLAKVPLLQKGDPVFLHQLALALRPVVCAAGDWVIRQGEVGSEMYFLCRGQVEAVDSQGKLLNVLGPGDYFGELGLLLARPRTASVRAVTSCDLFVLDRADFQRALRDYPQLAATMHEVARERYHMPEG